MIAKAKGMEFDLSGGKRSTCVQGYHLWIHEHKAVRPNEEVGRKIHDMS
jgi:hypothetical protein